MKEVVSRVREAETGAEEARRAAAQKAKEAETAAVTAGRELLAKAKADAAAQAEKLLEEARRQADALDCRDRKSVV